MDGFSIATGVVSLVGTAFSIIQTIRKAREAVKGASRTLDSVSSDLDSLQGTLKLIEDEPRLQTQGVQETLNVLIAKEKELQTFFDTLVQKQSKHKVTKFLRALKDGDKDDKELQSLLSDMSGARETLSLRIQVIHVGLTGNQSDGFRVAYDVLVRVDANVKKVLGSGLGIARALEGRSLSHPEDGTIRLTDADVRAIQEVLPTQAMSGTERFRTHNLKAGDGFSMFEGDLGFDTGGGGAEQHQSTMDNVQLGNDAKVYRGNVSKAASGDFISAFYGAKATPSPSAAPGPEFRPGL
ncbi:hypothetical protein DL98DRAFT_522089 [Cadophora sp. DSE1049]|nr:hypothetical protein DL98DRAFT_522089 [Cadophora sp. DSE1049]